MSKVNELELWRWRKIFRKPEDCMYWSKVTLDYYIADGVHKPEIIRRHHCRYHYGGCHDICYNFKEKEG